MLLNGQQIEALWRAKGKLEKAHLDAIAGIYNTAARGLFRAGHPKYFEAVAMQHRLGLPLSRHSRVAAPLARVMGLRAARAFVSLVVP